MPPANAPTAKQLSYLRRLAEQTATTFTAPKTRGQASREIKRLKTLAVSFREDAGASAPRSAKRCRRTCQPARCGHRR